MAFLCFESDNKRSAFPEERIISIDDNGFTMQGAPSSRGTAAVFFRMDAFKGLCQSVQQALAWVRRTQPQQQQKRQ